MTLNQLVQAFAEEIDLPELQLNAMGVCQLAVDGGVAVTIEDAPLEDAAHLYASLGRLPVPDREALMLKLLEAQLFNREIGEGCAFGYDPESEELLVCRRLSLLGMEPEAFTVAITELIHWTEHWMEKLAEDHSVEAASLALESEHYIRA